MNLSILVVEDEPLIADDIAETLARNGYEVAGTVDNGEEALETIKTTAPHLALLDINIEGDMDGLELATHLSIPFIFLTSYYDKGTLSKVSALNPAGFIVKPFSERDLIANVEISQRSLRRVMANTAKPTTFFVRDGHEVFSVKPEDIVFAEAIDNYTYLYVCKRKFMISHTLKSIEEKLIDYGFIRIHRSYLINFDKIDSISENKIYLKGNEIPIGKSYRKAFYESLEML